MSADISQPLNRGKFVALIFLFWCASTVPASSQVLSTPKYEMRGAWIATVTNIDWPSQPGLPAFQQQLELESLLDQLKAMGINAVFFQVRSECDAMYQSSLEPWSYWLTGKQGTPPSPFYDPLQFAIQEAHKRGMELHAWFNPYRALRDTTQSYDSPDQSHVTIRHPDWILISGPTKYLNPGLPQVRDYITSVFMDVARRYPVDGIHMDDYFYPYPPSQITYQDSATFRLYNRGFSDINAWRRDNINLLVREIHDSLLSIKPQVKWGISPFGIWKDGVPAGTTGLDQYSTIYSDPIAWLDAGTIDYIAPQLYWPNGGGQDYAKLMPWWADSTSKNGRQLYVGQAAYRIPNWSAGEMERQILQNRSNGNVNGSIFFSANSLTGNFGNISDSLSLVYYRNPALVPRMNWKDTLPPNAPSNLRYANNSTPQAVIVWNAPAATPDGDTAARYLVYRFNRQSISSSDLDSSSNIISITGQNFDNPPVPQGIGSAYYAVTTVDQNNDESQPTTVMRVDAPAQPLASLPPNGLTAARDSTLLEWNSPGLVSEYALEVSSDSSFQTMLDVNASGLTDTSYEVTRLNGLKKYFWRVKASNAGGTGPYSSEWNFTTAFPLVPALLSPASATANLSLTPKFTWNRADSAFKYRFQLTQGTLFVPPLLVDTTLTDTTISPADSLKPATIYAWRVSAGNDYGFSNFSNYFNFRTTNLTLVASAGEVPSEFVLNQNYPNPFNPSTTITFSIPDYERVSLNVYDILGRSVGTLINKRLAPGNYSATFDGAFLPSGVYICRLIAEQKVAYIKLLLLK